MCVIQIVVTFFRAPHGYKTKCDTATLKVVEMRHGLLSKRESRIEIESDIKIL